MTTNYPYRFQVALSFAGDLQRVESVAEILARSLGSERVLYYPWYRGEFARPNLDVYLPSLYLNQSRLLVFFFSKEHAARAWTGLEWRNGRQLIMRKEDARLMLLRVDDTEIEGLLPGDGWMDIDTLTDQRVADAILSRLEELAPTPRPSIESVINKLRNEISSDIQRRCSRLKVLSMETAVDLGSIYTSVFMLQKRTANQHRTKDELIRDEQNKLAGAVPLLSEHIGRVSGMEALRRSSRIIIYGKPGSGKTTFLKHLANDCVSGVYRPDLVPLFITLRTYADEDPTMSLSDYIKQQWRTDENGRSVLEHGLALVLLDGLDEVKNHDFTRIRRAIERFSQDYPLCTIALTCRIAAREYVFETFTEVEMADFDRGQVVDFAHRWFSAHGDHKKTTDFIERLEGNKGIRELASNPLLLTLLCLVYQERNEFDGTRADLYKQGIDVLLFRWDSRRDIERDFPAGVSKAVLEPLLAEIAYSRFLTGEYFFEQSSLANQISEFFRTRNLRLHDTDPNSVINAIEAHVGLLVARAVNVYSFSHLTFQEYLTALQAVRKPSVLVTMSTHIGDLNWREVWLLLSTMLDADDILVELKYASDLLVDNNTRVQALLWSCYSKQINTGGYNASVQAMYVTLEANIGMARQGGFTLGDTFAENIASVVKYDETSSIALDKALGKTIIAAETLSANESLDLLAAALDGPYVLCLSVAPRLAKELDRIRKRIPRTSNTAHWLERHHEAFIQDLLSSVCKYRKVGCDLHLEKDDIDALRRYIIANQVLLDCMDASNSLTSEARKYLETNMLLPYDCRAPYDK
jgi:NACHT domain